MQRKENYKDEKELINLYNKINELGGELLLNLGPTSNGDICDEEWSSLVKFGFNNLISKKNFITQI